MNILLATCRLAVFLALAAYIAAAELRVGRSAVDESAIKALVLDDGETRALLIVCDVLAVDDAVVKASRKLIAAQSSIPETNIMIAATGVRTARTIASVRLGEAARLAVASLQPATAWAGAGREDSAGFYNRFLMKDGNVRANPGRMNPDIVQPAGEADPDLVVALFENTASQPLAIFGSFSMRADALDYPSVIARTLGKLHGLELVTIWSTGTGANVSNIDVRAQSQPQPGPAEARRVGTILAGEAIKACARASRLAAPRLAIVRETVKIGALLRGPSLETEVQVIALGPSLAWVGLPGELWTELGSAIRKASPFPQTLLVGLANGSAGVLPNRKGYEGGDLEPGVRASAGAGETIADAALRLLASARRSVLRP